MTRRTPLLADLRQAFVAWTLLLAMALVWSAAPSRSTEFPSHAALATLAAVQSAEPVATLSAAGKLHRAPEFRAGDEPDAVLLSPALALAATGARHAWAFCQRDLPCAARHRTRPEPRAPPLI
ncbi:hypothetical protein [Pseudorhodobacter sp. MZDSW-24AT]|uniref:hypothetical protein n=1 Tax=Pseudorhodobacter sp. MZDSW-24AT TaxID=2052957 RepID=UPI000C1E9EBC|nr:hypothetical protein [Pseudorhodobacter sp. MZDSW-24AT]PJF09035.1 hypothetical protein CUR21_11255 [Pseudorhodobacter sp. MZDSW-24AT]